MSPPELERERHEFDPIVEGSRHGLTRELALAIGKWVCEDATDEKGRIDETQARRRFHEIAARIALRGGRLVPEVGKWTRAGIELGGGIPSAARGINELTSRVPGRTTLVAADAQRWPGRVPGRTTLVSIEAQRWQVAESAMAERPAASSAQVIRSELPGAENAAHALTTPQPRPEFFEEIWRADRRLVDVDLSGRRTLVADAPARCFGFEDYRVLGLRELLQRLAPDLVLRRAVLAAADRTIARHAVHSEHLPLRAIAPDGDALWRAAERHAVTLYRHAVDSGEVDEDDPALLAALEQRGGGRPLPIELCREMEDELGVPLARVRVHTDAIAARAARAARADALTVGEDIFFADNAFAPETPDGRRLLVSRARRFISRSARA